MATSTNQTEIYHVSPNLTTSPNKIDLISPSTRFGMFSHKNWKEVDSRTKQKDKKMRCSSLPCHIEESRRPLSSMLLLYTDTYIYICICVHVHICIRVHIYICIPFKTFLFYRPPPPQCSARPSLSYDHLILWILSISGNPENPLSLCKSF